MTEAREGLNFEQALEALRMEVRKVDAEQFDQNEEFPGRSAFQAAITAISLMPEAPKNLLHDVISQTAEIASTYHYMETEGEKAAVKMNIKRALNDLMSRIDPQRRQANYGGPGSKNEI